jgi:hypothetical protein
MQSISMPHFACNSLPCGWLTPQGELSIFVTKIEN